MQNKWDTLSKMQLDGKVNSGCFTKKHKHWSLENFNEGYVRSKDNRFFVYFPGHPRSSASGFVLRSIVAYEAYHNDTVSMEYNIHHKDGDRLNDTKENLQKFTHREHSILHNKEKKNGETYACCVCGSSFYVPAWRVNDRVRHMNKRYTPKYCSKDCYQNRSILPSDLYNDFADGVSLRKLEKKYKICRSVLSRELIYASD
jgi:hypothetical protein